MTEIVLCIGCLAMIGAFFIRELEHKRELVDSYMEGYHKGLNEHVEKMCSEEAE